MIIQRNSLNLTYYKGRVKNENSFFTRPFYLAGNNLFLSAEPAGQFTRAA